MSLETDLETAQKIEEKVPFDFKGSRYRILVEAHHKLNELPSWVPKIDVLARTVYFELGTVRKGLGMYGSDFDKELADLLDTAKSFIENNYDVRNLPFGTVPAPVP